MVIMPGSKGNVYSKQPRFTLSGDCPLTRRQSREEEGLRMSKAQVVSELWQFMRENKKYWLAPIVITLVLVGALLVLAKGSAIAPFIYTLF